MDEARAVIARLERIDRLRADGGSRAALLAEVRKLLEEGEAWIATERATTDQARRLLDECRRRTEAASEATRPAA